MGAITFLDNYTLPGVTSSVLGEYSFVARRLVSTPLNYNTGRVHDNYSLCTVTPVAE